MRTIDMDTWPRRTHFEVYRAYEHPLFSMCADVDVTAFRAALRERGVSFTIGTVYLLARSANEIPEFRHRVRGDAVVEHDVVHPSTTILTEGDLFGFCAFEYTDDFADFAADASRRIAEACDEPTLEDEPGRDDFLFMTAIPWVSFTSFMHPSATHPPDSVPRFAWGKYYEDGEMLKMPLSVQGHHALMDGLHVGRFYEYVRDHLREPEDVLG